MLKQLPAALAALMVLLLATRAPAQTDKAALAEREAKLIKILQSDAPPAEKAITCKYLVTCGSKAAVPAVAALLTDPHLTSWARIALEAIPDPAADDALRAALDQTQGIVLIGVINSIGVRRDAKAVAPLTAKLKDADVDVACAAAVALGRIGNEEVAKALVPLIGGGAPALRSAAALGCIYFAEHALAARQPEAAVKLYDAIRAADLPKPRLIEATRGAVLARGNAGIPLLLEQLHSANKDFYYIGLRVARELPGTEATDALVAEFAKAPVERQPLILLALSDRGDAKVLPVILAAAKSGAPAVRVAAAGVLERLGNASCVPVLIECAVADDADLAQAAIASLVRLVGKDIDAMLLARLQESTGKTKLVLIQLAEQRRIDGSMAVFAKSAADADPGVRTAAIEAIGSNGEAAQLPDLLGLFAKTADAKDRTAIEKAMMAIGGRYGTACVAAALPLLQNNDAAARVTGLHLLATCGGPEALSAVKGAMADRDEAVGDEAVRTLSNWPNRFPQDAAAADALLTFAKDAKKPAHQILALRGYFQFVQGNKGLSADQRVAKVNDVLPLLTRPEEKRLAIATLGGIGTGASLEALVAFAGDASVAEEACSTILGVCNRNRRLPRAQRQAALQAVAEKGPTDAVKNRAKEMLSGAAPAAAGPFADVTQKVAGAVKNGKVSITAGNEAFGDPVPDTVKQLRVDYTVGGKAHVAIVDENQPLQLPAAADGAGALVITKAIYGVVPGK